MSTLVSIAQFRAWAGAASSTVPDALIQQCLDEAEAGMCADLGVAVDDLTVSDAAASLATGEELRRSSRLLARRNSPEALSGQGDFAIIVPSRDPDSARTLQAIRSVLLLPEGVA